MIIGLPSLTFTELCDAVEKGEEVTFMGIDERNGRGSLVNVPAQVMSNLTIDRGATEEEETAE